jgi:hypothetical protein
MGSKSASATEPNMGAALLWIKGKCPDGNPIEIGNRNNGNIALTRYLPGLKVQALLINVAGVAADDGLLDPLKEMEYPGTCIADKFQRLVNAFYADHPAALESGPLLSSGSTYLGNLPSHIWRGATISHGEERYGFNVQGTKNVEIRLRHLSGCVRLKLVGPSSNTLLSRKYCSTNNNAPVELQLKLGVHTLYIEHADEVNDAAATYLLEIGVTTEGG